MATMRHSVLAAACCAGLTTPCRSPAPRSRAAFCWRVCTGQGLTVIRQPGPARDDTERMLAAMGAPITVYGNTIHSERPDQELTPIEIDVPGDISSAAFLLVAASIVPDSHITIAGVGVNPTRTGIVEALLQMDAQH